MSHSDLIPVQAHKRLQHLQNCGQHYRLEETTGARNLLPQTTVASASKEGADVGRSRTSRKLL